MPKNRLAEEDRQTVAADVAEVPNQVWSWDITYLSSTVKGQYYYLYLVRDIYSGKGVAWEMHECESGEHTAKGPYSESSALLALQYCTLIVVSRLRWYNHEHLHNGIRYVTPADRHAGKDADLLLNRD
ncbi:hypothetical protein ACJJI4_03720 [Microbulbifer sp. TRSA002]|uniref:hypothetical protein n=1 Tax=Microbulbifer sp. TRSA002 TaxID=3243382 RepID=UPI0040395F87